MTLQPSCNLTKSARRASSIEAHDVGGIGGEGDEDKADWDNHDQLNCNLSPQNDGGLSC